MYYILVIQVKSLNSILLAEASDRRTLLGECILQRYFYTVCHSNLLFAF